METHNINQAMFWNNAGDTKLQGNGAKKGWKGETNPPFTEKSRLIIKQGHYERNPGKT